MIRLQLEEAVLFSGTGRDLVQFTDLGSVCGLCTALLFNDNAMTQRFLNYRHSFHVEVNEKYHVCLPSNFLKSRSGNFW